MALTLSDLISQYGKAKTWLDPQGNYTYIQGPKGPEIAHAFSYKNPYTPTKTLGGEGDTIYTDPATGQQVFQNDQGSWYGGEGQIFSSPNSDLVLPRSVAQQISADPSLIPEFTAGRDWQQNVIQQPRSSGGFGKLEDFIDANMVGLLVAGAGAAIPGFGFSGMLNSTGVQPIAAAIDAGSFVQPEITAANASMIDAGAYVPPGAVGTLGTVTSAPGGSGTLLADAGITSDVPQGLQGMLEETVSPTQVANLDLTAQQSIPVGNELGGPEFPSVPGTGPGDPSFGTSWVGSVDNPGLFDPGTPGYTGGAGFDPEAFLVSSAPGPAAEGAGLSGVNKFLKDNSGIIGLGTSLGGLALAAAAKPKIPQMGNLRDLAESTKPSPEITRSATESALAAGKAARDLIPSVETGKLPPGAEMDVSNALNDAIQSIRSKYAQLGISGSTMEAQEISQARSRAEGMRFELANQLTKTGLAAAGIPIGFSSGELGASANIYSLLMDTQLKSDLGLQQALANFAAAAARGQALSA